MFGLIFWILMLLVFGNILIFAIKMAWGITKVIFSLIFLPFVLVFLVLGGLLKIAFPLLAVIGLISLFTLRWEQNYYYNIMINYKEGTVMAKNDRFEKVYSQGTLNQVEIWVDKETGVNYLFRASGYAGGLTVLLDRDGKPVVSTVIK